MLDTPPTDDFEVILVAYRSARLVQDLLSSLPTGTSVAVVDNAQGADGLEEAVLAWPNVRYLTGPGRGFAAGANLGVRTSTRDVVVFVNPDSCPTAPQLGELVSDVRRDSSLIASAAATTDGEGRVEIGVGGFEPTVGRAAAHAVGLHKILPHSGLWARPRPGLPVELDWLSAACMAVRRDAFLELGGFDESYFVYNEDVDFGRRVRASGYRMQLRTDVLVPHRGGSSGEAKPTMLQQRGASLVQYVARHNSAPRVLGIKLALTTGYLPRIALCRVIGRRATADDHSAYLRGLWGGAPVRPSRSASEQAPGPGQRPAVLMVVDSLRDNGGLRVAIEYVRQWNLAGLDAQLIAVQDVDDVALAPVASAVPVTYLTSRNRRFRFGWPIAFFRAYRRARKAAVVMAGSETGIGLLLSYLCARLARRPIGVLVQADVDDAIATYVPSWREGLTRHVLRNVDVAICVAESIVEGVVRNGLRPDRVQVVVNGVDVAAVRARAGMPPEPGPAEPPITSAPGRPVIVGLGRLTPQKDFSLLIRAHARALAAGIDHELVIIGEGPERRELETVMSETGVTCTARLAGYVDNAYQELSQADVFVLSSRTEGMPLSLLEAMAVGTPVIATRCGAGVDLVLDGGKYGELVAPESVEDLAAAIERYLRDPQVRSARAAAGPLRAMEFDVGSSASAVYDALARVAHSTTTAGQRSDT